MRSTRHPLLALAALACACDSQADGKYLGEPLASFDGYVSRAGVAPLKAAMLSRPGIRDAGTANPGTARWFCRAPYRLSVALPGEQLVLDLGTVGLGPAAGSGAPCPP